MSVTKTERPKALLVGCLLGGALALLFLRPSVPVWAQEPGDQPVNLDIILLIDNSWSMSHQDPVTEAPPSDPEELRVRAAKFLVDYLRANAEILEANFRVGAASFGGVVSDTVSLRLLRDEAVREGIHAEEILHTDFRAPLQFALRELEAGAGTDHRTAVILLTDGRPQLTDDPMTEPELRAYFEDLGSLIGDLREEGASLFVLGIGDARKDRENWTQLLPREHYIPIASASELADVYLRIVTELIGAAASSGETTPAGREMSIDVEPHLERVVFSFMKEDPTSRITLTSPAGAVLTPTVGGTTDVHHAIYGVANPEPGTWRASSEGEVRYWVDKRYPLVRVESVESPSTIGQPLSVTASLVRDGVAVVDRDLRLEAEIALPDGHVVTQVLSPDGEGRYAGSWDDVRTEGIYTVTARAFLDGQPLPVRPLPATVEVVPPSRVSKPTATPAALKQVTPTPTPKAKPPWAGLARPGVGPLLWFTGGLAFAAGVLLWVLWGQISRSRGAKERRGSEGVGPFMKAVRSRDYVGARAMLAKEDRTTQAQWLYRAASHVCGEELYGPDSEPGARDDEAFQYDELASDHLRQAGESYAAGEVEALRDECASVLACIKYEDLLPRVSDEVRSAFVRWFGDAADIELDHPARLRELLSHAERLDQLREILRTADRQAIGGGIEEERELVSSAYREATERAFAERGWEGVVLLWGLGAQGAAVSPQMLIGQLLVEEYAGDILNGILSLVNAVSFADAGRRRGFYAAVSEVLKYASEEARRRDRELGYLLCDGFARLLWAVANGNARGASLALEGVLDALDGYDRGWHLRFGEDVFGFCYLLTSLDVGRALSGDGRIYFFEEARGYLEQSARYGGLLDPEGLLALQDRRLEDDAGDVRSLLARLRELEERIAADEALPEFERTVVTVLLKGLSEVAEERGTERPSRPVTMEEGRR